MELKWLEDFVMLANTASFSRAADARNVTQSAFSRRIRQLEAWLGTTLISRTSLPAELTDAGKTFLPIAQEIIRTCHGLRETWHPKQQTGERRITFAALHTLAMTFLPTWLEQARATLPGLVTAIIPDRGGIEANLEALTSGEADLLLTYAHPFVPLLLDPMQFDWRVLGAERLVPVTAPALAEALELPAPIAPDEGLIERAIRVGLPLPYLDYGDSSFFGVALQRVFAGARAPKRQVVHQNAISAGLRECALAGWGFCWLPEDLVRRDLETARLVLASHSPDWILPLDIRVYRQRAEARRTTEEFWAALRPTP